MFKEIKLSLIITSYNNSEYIKKCIKSVLNQTYHPYEIIITDDNSTDDSKKIINEIAKKNPSIKLIFNKKNLGVSLNRHHAILQAKGNFITTLDGDDFYYNKNKLYNEIKIIKKRKKENIIAFSQTILVDEKGKLIKYVNNIKEGYLFEDILLRDCAIPRDFIFSKKSYLETGGYDKKFSIFEDWDLKIRLAVNNQFIYTGQTGTAYRQHQQGLSSDYKKMIKSMNQVFNKNINLIQDKKKRSKIKKKVRINNFKREIKKIIKKIIRKK